MNITPTSRWVLLLGLMLIASGSAAWAQEIEAQARAIIAKTRALAPHEVQSLTDRIRDDWRTRRDGDWQAVLDLLHASHIDVYPRAGVLNAVVDVATQAELATLVETAADWLREPRPRLRAGLGVGKLKPGDLADVAIFLSCHSHGG